MTVCLDHSCQKPAKYPCMYVDDDSQKCETEWCTGHSKTVAKQRYCLRHAVIVESLGSTEMSFRRPPVRNRAASLVMWTFNDLDSGLRAVVAKSLGQATTITSLGLNPVEGMRASGQGWVRSWRIDRDDATAIVGIEATERSDHEVIATVNAEEVTRRAAPWVVARQHGKTLEFVEDAGGRALFYEALLAAIARGLGRAFGTPVIVPKARYVRTDTTTS